AKRDLSKEKIMRSRGTLCSMAPPRPSSGIRPVWVGHSCPTLLIRIRPDFSRAELVETCTRLQPLRFVPNAPPGPVIPTTLRCQPAATQLCHPPQLRLTTTLSSRAKLILSLRMD